MGTSEITPIILVLPPQSPTGNYSKGKLVGSLRKSPWIVSTVLIPPNYCSSSPWGQGGKGENAPGVLLGRVRGDQRDHGIPRFACSPHPVPCPPGPRPRPPAGRKRSLCGCDSRRCPFPARPRAGRPVSTAPSKFGGVGLAGRTCCGFDPEAGY